ncbi:rhomboid family intramembrane serine protease [Ferruginibacter sp.]|nr:rhomboid family intramembrane serine protease [Ferruginibacter sp.]
MNELSLFPVTFSIIAITVVVSLIGFTNEELRNKSLFYPYAMTSSSEYYRFLSHGLIHADYIHLFFNMFTLYSFGRFAEVALFNKTEYIILYVTALIASSIFDFIKNRNNSGYAALGASGAVSAVLFSTLIFDPWSKGVALFGILALPNIVFAVLYLWYCAYSAKRGGDNIGHNAHMWGSLYGFAFTAVVRPELFKDFLDKLMHPSF